MIAQEAMLLDEASTYTNSSIQEINGAISDATSHLREFRMAHLSLSKLLGDKYSQEQTNDTNALSDETHRRILDLKGLVKDKQDQLDDSIREQDKIQHESKMIQGEQALNEIKLRCSTLASTLGRSPIDLPDSQLLDVNKGLVQVNADVSRILDKVTEYAGCVNELDANNQLSDINLSLLSLSHRVLAT